MGRGTRAATRAKAMAAGAKSYTVEVGHTHENKVLLDALTTTQTELTQLETDSHTHGQNLETTSNVEFAKLILNNLPTVDPVNAGEVWNDAGVLKISSGT